MARNLLQCLTRGQLSPEQASHVMRVSLSKFVMTLLKIRLNDTSMDRVNLFFQQVMHATKDGGNVACGDRPRGAASWQPLLTFNEHAASVCC